MSDLIFKGEAFLVEEQIDEVMPNGEQVYKQSVNAIDTYLKEIKQYIMDQDDWNDLMSYMAKSGFNLDEKARIINDGRYLKCLYEQFILSIS